MKDLARKAILHMYKYNGLDEAFNEASNIIYGHRDVAKELGMSSDVGGQLKGEMAEVVLELFVTDYVQRTKGTFAVKNLIIPFKGTKTGFTELDVTLFTPGSIHLFESKSYDGKCTVSDICTFKSDRGSSTDVYRQSKLHQDGLNDWISKYIATNKIYKLTLFSFADNEIHDDRDDKYITAIPVINETNVEDYLNSIDTSVERIDINKVYGIIKNLNEQQAINYKSHMSNL